jgi:hypothetical protein
MPKHDDAIPLKAPVQVFGELDSVLGHSVKREIRRAVAVFRERLAGSALIPLHQHKVALVASVG